MITKRGNIGYHKVDGLWVQAKPVVCEWCEEGIRSVSDIGSVHSEARVPGAGLHEVVICSTCDPEQRPRGWTLWKFQFRHPEFQ